MKQRHEGLTPDAGDLLDEGRVWEKAQGGEQENSRACIAWDIRSITFTVHTGI